jgi:hypothetical protein
MKIAMISAWNEDSGVSVHAELIGREWVNMGHTLKVDSFFSHDFHGTAIVGKDEEYVSRCFTTPTFKQPYFDPRPILEADYDIFVAQDLGMLPKDGLGKIFPHIQRKASTLTIIHDRAPSDDPSFYQFDWDRIVCFDTRYKEFLNKYFPEEKICIIPFPCMPLRKGSQEIAREKLGLPYDKKIILIFGARVKEHLPILPYLKDVASKLPCLLLVVSQKDTEILRGVELPAIEIRKESPSLHRLYDYLHASDILIIHRSPCNGAVVSSAAYQCLGSGCPILASNNSYFETLKEVVVTYSDSEEFKFNLVDILTKGKKYQATQSAKRNFLKLNSTQAIAKRYIDLFEIMIEERRNKIEPQFTWPSSHIKSIDSNQLQPSFRLQSTTNQPVVPAGISKPPEKNGIESQQDPMI